MQIKCWGARGSSPVSGKEFVRYGGSTTCIEVRAGNPERILMIDFGTGSLPMGRELNRDNVSDLDVLITHTHWDHIMGFPLFPYLFVPGNRLSFHYNSRYQGNPEKLVVQDMMAAPHFPVRLKDLSADIEYNEVGSAFSIGPVKVRSIPLSHPNLGLGYSLEHKGRIFVFLTDNELGFRHPGGKSLEEYALFCRDADLLIHDAEFFTPQEYKKTTGFGHSMAHHVLELARIAGVKSLGLFHHNRARTDDQIDLFMKHLTGSAASEFSFDIFAVSQEEVIHL